jgi:DNA primase catalytic core
MEIQDIKQHLSIQTVLNHYNLKTDRHNMLKCPFHADDKPSMKIYPNTNTFNCFGCSKNGDQIEFIQLKENTTKHNALLKAAELCHDIKPIETNPIKTKPMQNHTEILTRIFESFKNGMQSPVSKKPKEYLQQRGLSHELLEVGYNSGQFHHRGKLKEQDLQACINAGLLIPYKGKTPNGNSNYTPFAKDCVIFPLKNKNGNIVSIYGRSINENGNGKHFYLKERSGLYPGYLNADTTKLIITEAIIDAASILQISELTEEYSVLSCYGTNGLTAEHLQAIKELQNLQEIIFFFDGDKAGNEAVEKHAETLKELNPNLIISKVNTPDEEDVNSLWVNYGKEAILQLLAECQPLSENGERKTETAESVFPSSVSVLRTENPDYITFTTEDLQIILLGGINMQQLDRLRVTLKMTRIDTANPLHSIRHTLDLYHSDFLEKFINKASEQLETGTTTLRKAMAELIDKIELYRLQKIESQKEQKPTERKLTDERIKKAIKYLNATKLMERTNNDIGRTGMIGEENNRLLMYLVFTSRLREQPLHIISLGASGTGKTYLQEKVSELIPEQHKLEITILSENAFYYFGQKELKNKLVLIEDMDGAENVLYPLRELQSKKKISKTIPIKDSKGNLKTITMKVEGPICLAGTTTKERLYEDNANRSLLIYLDSSKEHKEHIMNYQRKLSAGKIATKEEKQLIEFFKDMQTILKPIKVRNPFAEYLIIPEHVFKPLRTNSHYLAFIETITFYHQYQREVKTDPNTGESFIETTLEDIEWANLLLKDILLAKADELSGECRQFLENLKNWLKSNSKGSFYKNEIRESFRMNPSNLKYYLAQLHRYNYVKIVGGNRYKSGLEYEIINTEEYNQLKNNLTTALDEALNDIKKNLVDSVDNSGQLRQLSTQSINNQRVKVSG